MNTPARLGVYAAGLLAVFGLAAGIGAAAGPIDVGGGDEHVNEHAADPPSADRDPHDGDDEHGSHAGDGGATAGDGADGQGHDPETSLGTDPLAGGDAHGGHGDGGGTGVPDSLRLAGATPAAVAGTPFTYAFTVEGPGGPVVEFELLHERRLHLIVVSGDLVDFWHLHPEMHDDGTWHVDMPPLPAGVYAVYADMQPVGGAATTLRQRLTVTATAEAGGVPRLLPSPAPTAHVAGFDVGLTGTPVVGSTTLQFDVTRDGVPVATEPYLGAAGHLVAIRASDLAYLHVHPLDEGSPSIRFAAELAQPGTYRLFLDFSVDGTVHTAAFTLEVPSAGATTSTPPHDHAHDHAEDHG